ncbi:PhoH family protein [Vallitalea okinawensis]|uniref:PhoH family protein n=1 Tax=Vallitalea okinawensis TaxID=2078660 RepID=UPI000CFDA645|nr:PhoH family protein [Vallitalea okinawensis]
MDTGRGNSIIIPEQYMTNIFGNVDENIKAIEKGLDVTITNRGDEVKVTGSEAQVDKAVRVINQLAEIASKGDDISLQHVNYLTTLVHEDKEKKVKELYKDVVAVTKQGKQIRAKTLGQQKYIDLIRKNMVVFGIGPAGTGKTYLAMAMAITAFKNNEVNRIILTRPAIEAGEKLGFLPGDLQSKVDPYLRPLYDALYEIMGAETFMKNMERGTIEVAPLAYMRGRTLDNSFIVLDEAQNTTPAQMKMFLTRIGFGSKAVITGDVTQVDLGEGKRSGLKESSKILKNVEGIGFANLTNKDVVRHPLVQRIVNAYDKYESKKSNTHKHHKNDNRKKK